MDWQQRLGTVGVWRGVGDTDPEFARSIEQLGYGALWLGASPPADLEAAQRLLEATEQLVVATVCTDRAAGSVT